uniref:Regulatory protein zeste n=1 Tax=Caenorhabditis japonica TaxID=281687 RepID=A0A8R1I4S1_CAEJA
MQMLSNNNVARPNKISRDVSNFIITQVLERSDDLIKNSYRRLTTENVARNGHWAEIAVKVSKHFDIPAEMERVKSHFHNRKKVLLARIKDELKNVPNSQFMSTEEKLEELTKRKICVGEYDEQLAKVCLDIEEEERGRTEQYGIPIMETMFTETSTQSLLSQLLSTPNNSHYDHRSPPFAGSKESESAALVPNLAPAPPIIANRSPAAPLLAKLLTDPSTSKGNDFVRSSRAPSGVPERKRRVVSPMECHRSPILPNPNSHYLSHLIVDVTSPQELKRLLSVLGIMQYPADTWKQHVRFTNR